MHAHGEGRPTPSTVLGYWTASLGALRREWLLSLAGELARAFRSLELIVMNKFDYRVVQGWLKEAKQLSQEEG